MGNGDDIGIPVLGDGLMGVMGVQGMVVLKRPLLADPPGVAVMREGRRWGVEIDDVERASEDVVRLCERGWLGFAETGDVMSVPGSRNFDVDLLVMGLASPSCHWRCDMTDFIAH
jgi:hypothetical protein